MSLVKQLESSLSEIVAVVKTVEGVVGVILFGSFARGEADEGSDVDLLVLFEDEGVMRRNEWEVTRRMPADVFAQSICVCPSTLEEMNPVFLQAVLEEGVILYMRHPLVLRSHLASTSPHLVVTYSLKGLSQREKQRGDYRLFGRTVGKHHYDEIVRELGGKRLGRGCFLIPKENAQTILDLLDKHNVKYELMDVYVPDKTKSFLQKAR
ncbi:MAG: nucleotidyltransferase family protein [Candidatus Bathyarchaeia archaeon]